MRPEHSKARCRILVIIPLLGLVGNSRLASGQTMWLGEVRVTTQFTHVTPTVTVRPGDRVVVEGTLNIGPGGPSPTTMNVWTASGRRFTLGPGRTSDRISFLTTAKSDQAYGHIFNWDKDDSGRVRIGIEPRPDLIALAPRLETDGAVSYGYRVGNRSWDPYGNRVTVQLWYRGGQTIYGPIDEKTLLTRADAQGWFRVPPDRIPAPPSNGTHLIVLIDRLDVIPESDENNNRAETQMPNLKVLTPRYATNGDIEYGYQITSAPAVTNQSVELELYYARGPRLSDIISSPRVHATNLDLNPGPERRTTLKVGNYPLPPHDATHLVAVIDRRNAIREGAPGEADNVATSACQMAYGYQQLGWIRGVGVYRTQVRRVDVFATVVHLRDARLGQLGSLTEFPRLDDWWSQALRFAIPTRPLAAVVNGTFFEHDWFNPISGQQRFSYGLKVDGTILDAGSLAPDRSRQAFFFTYSDRTVALIPYSSDLLNDAAYPNLIGAISGNRRPANTNTPSRRHWVGVRDAVGKGPRGEKRCETVVFLTTSGEISFREADAEMEKFGLYNADWAQLDGGGSATLIFNGNRLSEPNAMLGVQRRLPHVIILYGGS